jgi:hypothetical protein
VAQLLRIEPALTVSIYLIRSPAVPQLTSHRQTMGPSTAARVILGWKSLFGAKRLLRSPQTCRARRRFALSGCFTATVEG